MSDGTGRGAASPFRDQCGVDEHAPCLAQQIGTGIGQFDAPFGAAKQRRADFLFQLLDLARQRRLRHAQLRCRAAEVQRLGDGNEIAQAPASIIDTFFALMCRL